MNELLENITLTYLTPDRLIYTALKTKKALLFIKDLQLALEEQGHKPMCVIYTKTPIKNPKINSCFTVDTKPKGWVHLFGQNIGMCINIRKMNYTVEECVHFIDGGGNYTDDFIDILKMD